MRIVSLLAGATEIIAALGCLDQLVGRSHECDYPPEIQHLPVVSTVQINTQGSSAEIDAQIKQLARARAAQQEPALQALSPYSIDIDLLQQLQPDVLFTQTQCEVCAVSEHDVAHALRQYTGLHPHIISLSPYRLSDVWEDVQRVGQALARPAQAKQLVATYQQRLDQLHARAVAFSQQQRHNQKPRVLVLEWLDPLMTAGNWTPELVAYANGENLCGESGMHLSWLTWEELVKADPAVLILSPCGFTLERIMAEVALLRAHPAWQSLQAVQQKRVYAIDGNAYLNRSGPRLVESAELLASVLWGDHLGIEVDAAAWQHVM